jgi:hypothetical protein
MPPRATIRHETPENRDWFGRVSAAIEEWNPSKSALLKEYLDLFFSNRPARETAHGLNKLLVLLEQAQADLQLETRVNADGMAAPQRMLSRKVFIGHGRSSVWLHLKTFLNDRLHLTCVDFNAEAVAGITTTARLQKLLDDAGFAFLVMTAEDTHADNSSHARENVIHEAGLFQGRLGFERAIILLEEGCAQFSNIHGLTHISFPKGNVEPAFERVRQVLEREDVIGPGSLNQGTPLEQPGRQVQTPQRPAPLVFDGFRAWKSLWTFPVPLGTQSLSVVWVKNNQLSSGLPIHNVKAGIDYLYNGQPMFSVDKALWWEEHFGGNNSGVRQSVSVDLEANESQCFPVFMQGDALVDPQSAMNAEHSTKDLKLGRWTTRITVTADYQQPIKGEIEFTVYKEPGEQRHKVGCHHPLGITRLPIEWDWTDLQ